MQGDVTGSCVSNQLSSRGAGDAPFSSLCDDVIADILRKVSEKDGGLSHALVCKNWKELTVHAQSALAVRRHARLPVTYALRELKQYTSAKSLFFASGSVTGPADSLFGGIRKQWPDLRRLEVLEEFPLIGLSGNTLAQFLRDCSEIEHLSLQFQSHAVDLAPSINSLGRLKFLDLYQNDLLYIPTDIGKLSLLTTLRIRCFEQTLLPGSFCQLTNLQELWLASSSLRKLPDEIGNLTSLKILRVEDSVHIRSLPSSFVKLQHLQALRFSLPEMEELPSGFSQLSRLVSLDVLQCERLQNPLSLEGLAALRKLSSSHLFLTNHGGNPPGVVAALSRLELLEVCGTPACMWSFTGLRSLHLRWTGFARVTWNLQPLGCLQSLEIEGGAAKALPKFGCVLPRLTCFAVRDFPNLGSLPHDLSAQSALTHLSVSSCERLLRLPSGMSSLQRLESLSLSCCRALTRLPEGIDRLPQLESLALINCSSLGGLQEVLPQLSGVKCLELSGCPSMMLERPKVLCLPQLSRPSSKMMSSNVVPKVSKVGKSQPVGLFGGEGSPGLGMCCLCTRLRASLFAVARGARRKAGLFAHKGEQDIQYG